ncbi:plasmid partitioning protein RepB [Ochrobactrum chromiisoli]|uniref:Plasmid partitioning protein RepB n=1 Tax=Ochrobactrum chromiisoli TaxID=2993941 RepID=A0ABT3QSR5_9HYPH|nr:plasmid partitioning protein RepB [Ochrobactrum chromiisoli]MCX2698683.1 plasmid partitioning protein RepB [Ochrobactrum chromiisoli]
MSRKETISNLFLQKRDAPISPSATKPSAERVRSGAISAMGASLKEMAETAKQAADLQKQLEEANTILEIEPTDVEPSKIKDRITIEVDREFDTLVESIHKTGQQVPVLVRPSPGKPGFYQIAYGRRRLRAAQKLGIKVKAIVKTLTDDELILAQSRENLDRQDLSFIEKAFFAKNMEDSGIDRSVIISALDMDKADVSRLISVANKVPNEVIQIIGSAPKAGRKRWLELLKQIEDPKMLQATQSYLSQNGLTKYDSDQRFSRLMSHLRLLAQTRHKSSENIAERTWEFTDGTFSIAMDQKPKQLDVSFRYEKADGLKAWFENNIERILEEFKLSEHKTGD